MEPEKLDNNKESNRMANRESNSMANNKMAISKPSPASVLKAAKKLETSPDLRGRPAILEGYEPALQVMRKKNMSYRAMTEFLKKEGVKVTYCTVRNATVRAMKAAA